MSASLRGTVFDTVVENICQDKSKCTVFDTALKISVKIGAHISTFSWSIAVLIPVVVFLGSKFFISDVTSSMSTKWNSKSLSKFFSLMAIMLGWCLKR